MVENKYWNRIGDSLSRDRYIFSMHTKKPPIYPQKMIESLRNCRDIDIFVEVIRDYAKAEGGRKFIIENTKQIEMLFDDLRLNKTQIKFEDILSEIYIRSEQDKHRTNKKLRLILLAYTLFSMTALSLFSYGIYGTLKNKLSKYIIDAFHESYDVVIKQGGILADKLEEFKGDVFGIREEVTTLKNQENDLMKALSEYKKNLTDQGGNIETLTNSLDDIRADLNALTTKDSEEYTQLFSRQTKLDDGIKELNTILSKANESIQELNKGLFRKERELELEEFEKDLENLLKLRYPD